jgi:hypothetical protein
MMAVPIMGIAIMGTADAIMGTVHARSRILIFEVAVVFYSWTAVN